VIFIFHSYIILLAMLIVTVLTYIAHKKNLERKALNPQIS
jgi:hypothetical protein